MMYRIRKKFKFEAAHQLSSAESAACVDCIHGHSYVVEVSMTARLLNPDGMVVDFTILTEAVKEIIDEWDHALLVPPKLGSTYIGLQFLDSVGVPQLALKKVVILTSNPTAEIMASIIYKHVLQKLEVRLKADVDRNLSLESIRVHETDTSYAEYTNAVYCS